MGDQHLCTIMKKYNLEIVNNTSSKYKCTICKNILVEACNAPCLCLFCSDCVKEYLKNGPQKCPGGNELCAVELLDIDRNIKINNVINIKISQSLVKCPNIGCESIIELKSIADHLHNCQYQCQRCPLFNLGCEEDKLWNDNIKDHLSNESYSHTKSLINLIISCTNEIKLMKEEIDKLSARNINLEHQMKIDNQTTQKIIENLQKQEMKNMEDIKLLSEEIVALKNENRLMRNESKSVKSDKIEQFDSLNLKIDNQHQQADQLKAQTETENKEIQHREQTRDQKKMQCSKSCRHQVEKIKEVPLQIDDISSTNAAENNETMDRIRFAENMNKRAELVKNVIGDLENIDNVGQFEWKISHWSDKIWQLYNEETFFSEAFFSHSSGYKMCLNLWLVWTEYYFSFCVLKGPFDGNLAWPFNRDVEIAVINQKTGMPHKTKTINCSHYLDYSNIASLERPTSVKNKKFSFDYLIISPSEISSNPELIKDNQLTIKISIKPIEHQSRM